MQRTYIVSQNDIVPPTFSYSYFKNQKTMDTQKYKEALDVIEKIYEWQHYVTKERFFDTARTKYSMERERSVDELYSLFQLAPEVSMISRKDEQFDVKMELALKIAEDTYERFMSTSNIFRYPCEAKKVKYFYVEKDTDAVKEIEIDMAEPTDVLALADLFKGGTVDSLRHISDYIGTLRVVVGTQEKKFPYYEGDIYLKYSDVTDRIFYDYYHIDDLGVYLATDEGWKKLFYTNHRGYLDSEGKPDIQDENSYSEYMMTKSGQKFRYIGNIHKDKSVLTEK